MVLTPKEAQAIVAEMSPDFSIFSRNNPSLAAKLVRGCSYRRPVGRHHALKINGHCRSNCRASGKHR